MSVRDLPWRILAVALAVATVLLLTLSWCATREELATERDQAAIADGRTQSAAAAITAIGDNAEADQQTQTDVKEAQDAIRQAAPADRDRVARRELCQLQGRSPC